MEALAKRQDRAIVSMLQEWWADHGTTVLRVAVVLMVMAALVWLGYQFWRLLSPSPPIWSSSPSGAVDLRLRHEEVHSWFAGEPVYEEIFSALYPPASYLMLWPLLGWLALRPARWLWAVTTVVMLVWLVSLTVRASSAQTRLEQIFVACIPLSMYATGATIGNGQVIVHLLPVLLAGLLILDGRQCSWREDVIAAALILFALVKPSISAPFFWIVLFVPGRLRPALFVVLGYVLLTLLATAFQETSLWSLMTGWFGHARMGAEWGTVRDVSGPAFFQLPAWNVSASLCVLAVLGGWIYVRRRADLWLLLGVTALVSLFWAYHGWYDDLLMLLPMVALFRIAKQSASTDNSSVVAGVLLALTLLTTLAPGGTYLLPQGWSTLYGAGQIIIWTAVFIFLLDRAWRANMVKLV